MAKKSKVSTGDKNLMLLAAAAVLVVGVFALFTYKPQIFMMKDMSTPDKMTTISLAAQNASGESGTVSFNELNGKTTVVIAVKNAPKGVSQPAHIHMGACPNPGTIVYPLTSLVNGQSTTIIDATLDQLKAQEPLAVNVHKSATNSKVYTACADLKF